MSRRLNVASALLFAVAIVPVIGGLSMMFLPVTISEYGNEEVLGVTLSQIRDFSPKLVDGMELSIQLKGLFFLALALFWSVIALIPYRKGEKWAWYAMLVIGAIFPSGWLILTYTGITLGLYESFWIIPGIIWLILWIVGLALPAKEILAKPSS